MVIVVMGRVGLLRVAVLCSENSIHVLLAVEHQSFSSSQLI